MDTTQQLTRKIGLRVSEPFYQKMQGWLAHSNCQTITELARHMLYQEKIIWYHKDATLDGVANELAGIKQELKSIGVNINQVTRYFNSTGLPQQKFFEALKLLDEYKKVTVYTERVTHLIENIKWSPK